MFHLLSFLLFLLHSTLYTVESPYNDLSVIMIIFRCIYNFPIETAFKYTVNSSKPSTFSTNTFATVAVKKWQVQSDKVKTGILKHVRGTHLRTSCCSSLMMKIYGRPWRTPHAQTFLFCVLCIYHRHLPKQCLQTQEAMNGRTNNFLSHKTSLRCSTHRCHNMPQKISHMCFSITAETGQSMIMASL